MSPEMDPETFSDQLRHKQKEALKTTRTRVKAMSLEEVQHLVETLQIQHVELEMQNEELRRTKLELETTRDRYTELFDLSPVGYVTLNEAGYVIEANLTFCHSLGEFRSNLLRKKFEQFIDRPDQAAFRQYLETLKMTAGNQQSDILTMRQPHPTYVTTSHANPRRYRVRLSGYLERLETSDGENRFRLAVEDATGWELVQDQQKAMMETVFRGVTDAVVTSNEDQRIVLVNPAAEQMFRCSASEVFGQPLSRFIPERFREAHHRYHQEFEMENVSARQMGVGREVKALRADGEEFSAEITISKVEMNNRSNPRGGKLFNAIIRDITERKQAEQALHESEERLQFALETGHTGAWVLDLTDYTADRSLEHDRIFGYSEKLPTWTYERFLEHVLPEDLQRVDEIFRRETATQSDWNIECRICRIDGEVRWIWAAGRHLFDEDGSSRRMAGIVQDITERKQAEHLLAENEKQLQAILDHSPIAIWLKDLEGRYLKVNRQFEKRAGRDAKEILGKTDVHLFPSQRAEHFHVVDQHVYQVGQAVEFDDMAPDDVHIEHVYKFPLMTPEGRAYALCGMATDITERKQAEMELHDISQLLEKQQQELRSLAAQLLTAQEDERRRIACELHDDINQRMALVSMQVSFARNGLPDSHPVFLMLQELYESIGKLSDDIRRLAHQYHPSMMKDLGLGPALHSLCHDLEKLGKISITCEVPEEKVQHCSQRVAICLYRVAQECFRNVTKYAEASGVHVELKEDPQEITLTIRDNGRGFNVKESSAGMGFLSMKERVQLLGGTFSVESQPGQGTTIRASVPKTET